MPYTLSAPVYGEVIVKKSRFIACVQPVSDRAQAQQIVASLWAEHPGAAHVCWALMAGGQSAAVDDGEPSGTAGRPMLEVLRHQELEGVLATVVRYFGGIKLGAGGLVGAYTDSVASALKDAEKVELVRKVTLMLEVPYALEGLIRRQSESTGVAILNVTHATTVRFCLELPEFQAQPFKESLQEAGQGRLVWLDPDLL